MKCIYCGHPYTYTLKNSQHKCSRCKRKFSLKKIEREQKLFKLFEKGFNARETAKQTGMHFVTVQKYYEQFRREIALQADISFQQNNHNVTGYDEYLYLPKSLKVEKNIHKLQHFFTLSYDDKVYNLMMPAIHRYHFNPADEQEKKLLLKYLNFNKIAKLSNAQNTITEFWDYFETFILQYKGVGHENFIFYLKEAEWRFNNKNDE
jgi:hypothetical protein